MKIWLIIEGEKSGPHESFEIRERIDSGELEGDTMAWFQGAEDWMPLRQVPLFSSLFDTVDEGDSEDLTTPPPIPTAIELAARELQRNLAKAPPMYLIRRMFARMHDSLLYLWIVLWIFQDSSVILLQDGGVLRHVAIGLAYVIFDGLMVHVWKASPGKWLLGVRTVDAFGHALPLSASLIRSLRVWVLGLGMWLMPGIAMLISGVMAWRLRYLLWDLPKRYRVVAQPYRFLFSLRYGLSLLLIMSLMQETIDPQVFEDFREVSEAALQTD